MRLNAMQFFIALAILVFYCYLIGLVYQQQSQIIELQKDIKQFTISQQYMALKSGIESGEQFPLSGEWYKCVKVITE